MKSGAKNIIRLALGRAGSTEGLLLAEVFWALVRLMPMSGRSKT